MTEGGGTSRWTPEQRLRERELFDEFTRLRQHDGTSPSEQSTLQAVRDELVTMHLGLVHHLARRYGAQGASSEDVVQVGILGLINAVDRFEPARGNEFSTFATPHIIGEMRKFFRDDSWAVHLPRRLRDLTASVNRARSELSVELGRHPTVAELSGHLNVPEEEILAALEAATIRGAASIDTPIDADGRTLADTLAQGESAFDQVENRLLAESLLAALPERERRIVIARIYEELGQSRIADELGISQVHVSRLLRSSLETMRRQALEPPEPDPD